MILRRSVTVLVIASAMVFASTTFFFSSAHSAARSVTDPQTDPGTSLDRGRALLRQGHADQALGYLETALNSYTQTNNVRGIAAAEDALGDLYMIQGQYKIALDHYQKAYQSFVTARGKDQTGQAAANSVASRAGSTAGAATETAG